MSLVTRLADAVWNPREQPHDWRSELSAYRPGWETQDLLATLDRCPDDQAAPLRELLVRLSLVTPPGPRWTSV